MRSGRGDVQGRVAVEEAGGLEGEAAARDRHDRPVFRARDVRGAERVPQDDVGAVDVPVGRDERGDPGSAGVLVHEVPGRVALGGVVPGHPQVVGCEPGPGRHRGGGIGQEDGCGLRVERVADGAAEAVLALSASPAGFTAADLARQVHSMSGLPESEYGTRRAAYDIKKFRAKGMVRKIDKSRRYEAFTTGLRSLTALLVLRERVIRPLLAASGQPDPPSQLNPMPIDRHYESLRAGMRDLLVELGMVA